MFTVDNARTVIAWRAVEVQPDDGSVWLLGRWRLHELEALCVIIRAKMNNTVDGIEEHLAGKGSTASVMPYAKLEAIVRDYQIKIVKAVALTIHEDVGQLNNPGSVPVYATPVSYQNRQQGLSFDQAQIKDLTITEFTYQLNAMLTSLNQLGCSVLTQTVAGGMLYSMVMEMDQEKAMEKMERMRIKTEKPDDDH